MLVKSSCASDFAQAVFGEFVETQVQKLWHSEPNEPSMLVKIIPVLSRNHAVAVSQFFADLPDLWSDSKQKGFRTLMAAVYTRFDSLERKLS